MNQTIQTSMGRDLTATKLDTDKIIEIIRAKVDEQEAKEFFSFGNNGESLFDIIEDLTQYPFVVTYGQYADALIEEMRSIIAIDLEAAN